MLNRVLILSFNFLKDYIQSYGWGYTYLGHPLNVQFVMNALRESLPFQSIHQLLDLFSYPKNELFDS